MSVARPDGPTAKTYRSYLVRLWQSNEQGAWRASAQCIQTGNTVMFGSTEQLMAFLQAQLGNPAHEAGPASGDATTDER